MENIRDLLAKNLKTARIAKGFTQGELAEKAGISLRAYQTIETSKDRWPVPEKLEALAMALGTTAVDLFQRGGQKAEESKSEAIIELSRQLANEADKNTNLKKALMLVEQDGSISESRKEQIEYLMGLRPARRPTPGLAENAISVLSNLSQNEQSAAQKARRLVSQSKKVEALIGHYETVCPKVVKKFWDSASEKDKLKWIKFQRGELGMDTNVDETIFQDGFDVELYSVFLELSEEKQNELLFKSVEKFGLVPSSETVG